jgi:hypothetical protein
MRQIIKGVLSEYTENLFEGSKRVKLSPRTENDLEYLSQLVWTASKTDDDDIPKKGSIMVMDPKGSNVEVPVFYLSELPAQGGVFPLDPKKPKNLYNLFIVVNPQEALNPSLKSTYHILYHELQHLMDLNSTEYLSKKREEEYSPENKDTGYWGHEFEFRAFSNEIMNAIYKEYTNLFDKVKDQEIQDSLDSMLSYFGKSGVLDTLGQEVLYSINSEKDKGSDVYPYVLKIAQLLKKYAPQRWNTFLKMLYNVTEEIKNELSTRGESQEVEQEEMLEKYDGPRKMGKSYCEKTPCKDMGFSQKASCRPYKDCYK